MSMLDPNSPGTSDTAEPTATLEAPTSDETEVINLEGIATVADDTREALLSKDIPVSAVETGIVQDV